MDQADVNAAAGVLVRISDGMTDERRPWRVGGPFGSKFKGVWPATFVNARHAGTYGQGGGLVIDATLAKIRCGYARDGRSMDKLCEGRGDPVDQACIPGCSPQVGTRMHTVHAQ